MAAFLEISTLIWIAGVFFLIKYTFKYLAWLYYDKDRTLRENIEQVWDYLSQHNYFEVMKAALARLYDRLSNIFQRRIRFLYLFLLFFFLNLVSLWLARCLIGINLAELKALLGLFPELVLAPIGMMKNGMGLSRSLTSVFQLSILDLYSFLFTMGIIWVTSRSKSLILFLIELITDISILAVFFVLVFQSLYYWLAKDISLGLFGSFFMTFAVASFFWMSYTVVRYLEHPDLRRMIFLDPFLPLWLILILPFVAFLVMLIIALSASSLRAIFGITPFLGLLFVFLIPIIIFWSFRILKIQARDKLESAGKFTIMTFLILLLLWDVFYFVWYHHLLSQIRLVFVFALTSEFVLILVFSSAFPTFAHLIAITAAMIAKVTPKWLQRFINRHLYALSRNEERVLGQLGNAFGGLGALITAVIKLI